MASPTDRIEGRSSSPADQNHRDDQGARESGTGTTASVIAFPVRDVARGPALRQSGRGEMLGETVRVSNPDVVQIDQDAVSLFGVTVCGMPGLSGAGGVIALQVEPRPVQRPRPRLVYDRGSR